MNANVCRQVTSLRIDHGVNVEILTWPFNDNWNGPIPVKAKGCVVPPLRFEVLGQIYHVINPPNEWNERPLRTHTWDEAVVFGMRVIEELRPDIVHLQHWYGLWWILESAQRLGVPTVYSNHDWGIACLRTVLVTGDGTLCDGQLSIEKCAQCILRGRSFIGKANEFVTKYSAGRWLIDSIFRSPLKTVFERYGAVRLPVKERVDLNLNRAKRILIKLDALFTPSEFGRKFFSQLGVLTSRIAIEPWYHDPIRVGSTIDPSQQFTITFVGRVSQEKGVHLIFEALGYVKTSEPILLRIVGANTTAYCADLKRKYTTRIGVHKVEWLGWSKIEPLYRSTDISIIPSILIDNTPLSLVEAQSYKVPVIATRTPPIEDLVVDGQNGYLVEYNSVKSLASAIERAVADKHCIRSGTRLFPKMSTCREYTQVVKDTYLSIRGGLR